MQATNRQTWAIFCMTGWDVRQCNLTKETASALISDLKAGKAFDPDNFNGAICIKAKENKADTWQKAFDEAYAAGLAAMQAKIPQPMIVAEHENMLDDNSPVKKQYFVEGGVCGFAWVTIRPGTHSFARWLKKHKGGHKAYYGGVQFWVSEGSQSYERKIAFADAMADKLRQYDIPATSGGRLD